MSADDVLSDGYAPDIELDDSDVDPDEEDADAGASLGSAGDDVSDDDESDVEQSPHARLTDDEISVTVRRLLRSDSATRMLRIQVSTEDGVVTLRGMVQTLDDTDNAAEVAARANGVLDVIDDLEVEP